MELKEFIKSVLTDVVGAVEETRINSSRDMRLYRSQNERTIEFDIAVTVEESQGGTGRAGIKVFQLIEGGGEVSEQVKNSTVSRIKFGVDIDTVTKEENLRNQAQYRALNSGQNIY